MLYILITTVILITAVLIISYRTYVYTFKTDPKRQALEDDVPNSKARMKVIRNIYSLMHEPFEDVQICSFDSLILKARYYHYSDGAPVAIMMHGYRSNYCRDGNGGFKIARARGYNILMPDQRAHGRSEGKDITFGISERHDCADWVDYVLDRFGTNTKIVLIGLSMGAATVMMASDIVSHHSVKAIIADCGFTSPKDIISEVASGMKIPGKLGYFFAWLGARLFGKFDANEASAVSSLAKTKIPVLFIHGEADTFVPTHMSKTCYDKCKSKKDILIVKNAAHGMSYYADTEGYTNKVNEFLDEVM